MVNKIKIGYSFSDNPHFESVDICVFAFGAYGEVNFKSELSGKSEKLSLMAKASKNFDAVCFFGAQTDSYGLVRKSVIACADGRLLGISDLTRTNEKLSVSCGYKIYNTKYGKIGVIVDSDIGLIDGVKSLSNCECDLIIDICTDFCDFRPDILIQAQSYLNGIAICFLCGNNVYASTPTGELCYSGSQECGSFSLQTKRKYSQWTIKSRG